MVITIGCSGFILFCYFHFNSIEVEIEQNGTEEGEEGGDEGGEEEEEEPSQTKTEPMNTDEEYELEEDQEDVEEEPEDDLDLIDDPPYEEKPARRPKRQKSLEEGNPCPICERLFKTAAVCNF